MGQRGLPGIRRVTLFTRCGKGLVMRYSCIRFVFGGLVATDTILARALELRWLAGMTGEAIGFCVSALKWPLVH